MDYYEIISGDKFNLYLATLLAGLTVATLITWIAMSSYKRKKRIKSTHQNGCAKSDTKVNATDISDELQATETVCPQQQTGNSDEPRHKTLSDSVSEAVKTKLNGLIAQKSGDKLNKVRDFAAIVLSDERNIGWRELVCIASGSHIIGANNLESGSVLIDSRAATLARRCFIRYLYVRLNELVTGKVDECDSIFVSIPASNRFALKANIRVNFFLNQPPDDNGVNHIKANGSLPSKVSAVKPLKLKSTSDKISLWNQVGIQGSLLSHFIDPIHINSVVIASDFKENILVNHFTMNYIKDPKLLKCEEVRHRMDSLSGAFVLNGHRLASNWIVTDDSIELINCDTGKAIRDDDSDEQYVSRLSKRALHDCFCQFLDVNGHNLRPNQSLPMNYRKWKESAPNYRIQKQLLRVRYAVAGRQWNTMPAHLDVFT